MIPHPTFTNHLKKSIIGGDKGRLGVRVVWAPSGAGKSVSLHHAASELVNVGG